MLEQQLTTITEGLRRMYRKLQENNMWEGSKLVLHNGQPLTHDILERLQVLRSINCEPPVKYEDDFEVMQQRLLKENGPSRERKASSDSTSSRGEFVKAESSDRNVRRSLESPCSTPTSGTFSISSGTSRKRSSETPASDTSSPAPPYKRTRTQKPNSPGPRLSELAKTNQKSYQSPEPWALDTPPCGLGFNSLMTSPPVDPLYMYTNSPAAFSFDQSISQNLPILVPDESLPPMQAWSSSAADVTFLAPSYQSLVMTQWNPNSGYQYGQR
jgi:hypothetical protein